MVLFPLALQFSDKRAKSQLRLILLVPCWVKAFWLSIFPNMLEGICQFTILKDHIRISLGNWVLGGLSSLHLTLWLFIYVCCTVKGFMLRLSGSDRGNSIIYNKVLLAELERNVVLVCSRGCSKQCLFLS